MDLEQVPNGKRISPDPKQWCAPLRAALNPSQSSAIQ
jgi:hypothetical protein